jgi:hypothetical protein
MTMKNLITILIILTSFALVIGISSCKKDKTDPVITLLGDTSIVHNKGDIYTDAGATAEDDVDGDITANIDVTNPIDVNVEGIYIIKYNVSDKAGNDAEEVTRKVKVMIF